MLIFSAAVIIIALILVAPAIVLAEHYTVWVGYELPVKSKSGLEPYSFIPNHLHIHVGDKVTFKSHAYEIHTATFYPDGVFPNLQQDDGNSFYLNLTIITPTVFPSGSSYDGSYFATSGILAYGQEWTVPFSKVGHFKYGCAVHGIVMKGSITVIGNEAKSDAVSKVEKEQQAAAKVVQQKAPQAYKHFLNSLPADISNPDGTTTHHILVGSEWQDGPTNYMLPRFFPQVHVGNLGDTVIFYGAFFHTVTFLNGASVPDLIENTPDGPEISSAVILPTGGTSLTKTGILSSGLIVDPTIQFKITLDEVGTYEYVCLVHLSSGMQATMVVKPR